MSVQTDYVTVVFSHCSLCLTCVYLSLFSGPITRMRVSKDDAWLFSAGEDGCLCVFEVKEKENRVRKDKADQVSLRHQHTLSYVDR